MTRLHGRAEVLTGEERTIAICRTCRHPWAEHRWHAGCSGIGVRTKRPCTCTTTKGRAASGWLLDSTGRHPVV